MRVFRATYKDRNGKQRKSAKWYLDFADHNQLRHKIPAFADKRLSEAFGRKIEALVNCRITDYQDMDQSYQATAKFIIHPSMRRLFNHNILIAKLFSKSVLSCFHSHSLNGPGGGPVPAKVRLGKLQTSSRSL